MENKRKEKAITLREEGKTYKEICSELDVAKSTLSLWLRSVQLSKPQKQQITQKRISAAKRGALQRKKTRETEVENATQDGIESIGTLSSRDLWLIGIALYWAEGSKQNVRSPSTGIRFTNTDYKMMNVFLRWLDAEGVSNESLVFELYIHKSRVSESEEFCTWWEDRLQLPSGTITRVYLKSGTISTNRTNISDLYHGVLRIKVKKSTSMNRVIQGLAHGIAAQLGSGVIGNTSAFEAEDSRIVP